MAVGVVMKSGAGLLRIGGGSVPKRIPPGLVSVANIQVDEDAGTATFTVQISSIQDKDVKFDYRTKNGTATAGVDYTAVSGSGTITSGQTSTTVVVDISDDLDAEDDETFTLPINNIRYA